jgi:predicted dehydrogenase
MKVAILGCGGMGRGAAFTLRKCSEVDGIIGVDKRPERVEALRNELGIEMTTDLDRALSDPEVKLCFVTASNDAHKPLSMAAFEAGKAVLCEKPIANTLADAEAMVARAEADDLFFQIGFELRYSRLYTTVTEWVEQGLLGQVVNTHCKYICSEFHHKGSWRNDPATGGSMFGEKLCHYVDLPRLWIGSEVVDVFSACAPNAVPYYKVRDNYQTVYRFANGAVSALTFAMHIGETWAGDPLQNIIDQQRGDGHELRYLVMGTRGAAETDVFSRTIKRWEFGDSPECMTSKLVETRTWDPKEDGHYFHDVKSQTRDVVRRVHAGEPPKTPARDSLETMRLVFAAEESADRGELVRLAEVS